MPTYEAPSRDEIMRNYKERRNWGRWGDDDSVGAINLITVEKRLAALASVQNGRTVSLSRLYPKDPSAINPTPAQHFIRTFARGDDGSGAVVDYYGFIYHGHTFTHIDALCHIWDEDGTWQGRRPEEVIDSATGATFADVTAWNQGIFTRGVLLDVPKFRGEPYVTVDRPVMGDELADIAEAQGVSVEPGDALLVYSGRDAYQADHPDDFFGAPAQPRSARLDQRLHPRQGCRAARLGHDGCAAQRIRPRLAGARGDLQLRRRAAGQRAAGAVRQRLRRRGALRDAALRAPAQRPGRHRLARQSDRHLLGTL